MKQENYLDYDHLEKGVVALKQYVKKAKTADRGLKNLLEPKTDGVFVEVVFKNIPSNSRTYIHNVELPHHWRLKLQPEIAIFVRSLPPPTEAMAIQFKKDRDLEIDYTHSHYEKLFERSNMQGKISRIISVKELATVFNTFQKLDRLAKTFDLFLSDKQLMTNKMNPLPRRLGRRFWVREKKVPLMLKLKPDGLDERFDKVMRTEPFYVLGRSSTEQIQVGQINQSVDHIVENVQAFLEKLYSLYSDNVRFIRIKTNWGLALPLYADLDPTCPKVVMQKMRIRSRPVIDEFDMLNGEAKISVAPSGSVRVIRQKRKKLADSNSSPEKSAKRAKKAT